MVECSTTERTIYDTYDDWRTACNLKGATRFERETRTVAATQADCELVGMWYCDKNHGEVFE